jgi:hypothetical protein
VEQEATQAACDGLARDLEMINRAPARPC